MIRFSIFVLYTQQHYRLFRLKKNAPLTTAHRNPKGLAVVWGLGVAVATKILIQWKKV